MRGTNDGVQMMEIWAANAALTMRAVNNMPSCLVKYEFESANTRLKYTDIGYANPP